MFNVKTFKTLEFWVAVLAALAAWLGSITDQVGTGTAVYVTAIAASLYALSRALAKWNSDVKDFWNTTEFYGLVIGAATALLADWSGVIGDTATKNLGLLIGLATAVTQARKFGPLAAGQPVVAGDVFHGVKPELPASADADDVAVEGAIAPLGQRPVAAKHPRKRQ